MTKKEGKKKIIFICKYNAFRSKFSEKYFKKINRDKNIISSSRGFIMGAQPDKEQKNGCKKFGIEIGGKPQPVNLNELIEADLIIVVAKDIPKIMFDYSLKPIHKKIIQWNIKDEQKMNKENIKRILSSLKNKLDGLNKKLENEN